jgi:protein MpaA
MRPLAAACLGALALIPLPATPAAASGHRLLLGRSVDGRPIVAYEVGDLHSNFREVVVGCIHGNEPAGIAIADQLEHASPQGVDLWIIPVLNPDGVAAGTRGNADRVDLNRNFPWRWRPLSGLFYSGPKPLSEPESQIAFRLLRRLRPQITIWFHQHMDLVDQSGGDPAVERRFAAMVGLPLVELPREPGSVAGWENHAFPGTTAFVVELPSGPLPPAKVRRYTHAVLGIAP